MDDLIIRVLSGEASPFEVQRLGRWRDESPENEARFQEVAQVWNLTAPEALRALSTPPEVDRILEAAASRIGGPPAENAIPGGNPVQGGIDSSSPPRTAWTGLPGGRRPSWRVWGLMAASVAALSLGIQEFRTMGPDPLAEYRTGAGETRTVTLDDGSFVRLAERSRLQLWPGDTRREVSLEGRAFFAVTRDESRPFRVRTGHGEVTVLGTRFEVDEEEAGLRAVVVEGLVVLANESGRVEVPAGSLARVNAGAAPTVEEAEDPWSLLDWPDGILVFQETPLSEVAREVSRHFGRSVVVAGGELGSRRITAWFQGESFSEVSEAICAVVGAPCEVGDAGVTIGVGSEGGAGR